MTKKGHEMRATIKTATGLEIDLNAMSADEFRVMCAEVDKLVAKLEGVTCQPVKTGSETSPTGSSAKLKLLDAKG